MGMVLVHSYPDSLTGREGKEGKSSVSLRPACDSTPLTLQIISSKSVYCPNHTYLTSCDVQSKSTLSSELIPLPGDPASTRKPR